MKRINVLVFPGGTEIGLEIGKSLRFCKEVRLFSASSGVANHAEYLYKNHTVISDIYSSTWVAELNVILARHNIDMIYPAFDEVIDALVEHADEINARIVLPEAEVVRLIRSKKATYVAFTGDLPVPALYASPHEIASYPVFVKPEFGNGSKRARLISSEVELLSILQREPDLLLCENLPGREYSVDCFSSIDGVLKYCAGRTRERIRVGTSMRSRNVSPELNERLDVVARIIGSRLKMRGAWHFQMKEDARGELKLLEISPRIAGTMALHRVQGVNFPLLSLFEFSGIGIEILANRYEVAIDRSLANGYKSDLDYGAVYVDLDDTLLIRGGVNPELIAFLYQCANRKKEIVLISKSTGGNKPGLLKKHRLAGLFDRVIWLNGTDRKADHIERDKNPIFIDDSYSQRREVSQQLGIPTFDPSMVEGLLDCRS